MDPSYDQLTLAASNLSFSVGYCQDLAELDADYQASIIREERRCRYPSKRCELPRAIKRNGEMHRFCDAHRSKANLNQRRLEARRKSEMKEAEHTRKTSSSSPESQPWLEPGESSPPLHSVLARDELNFLSELLSQNSLEDLHAESTEDEVNLATSSFMYDARFPC